MRFRFRKEGYPIATCRECGLTQIHPLPPVEVLENLYEEDYFASGTEGHGYASYAEQEAEYLATFDEDLRRIADFVPTGTALDVGCGYGYFVRQALAAGYDAYGVDIAKEAVAVAEGELKGRVFQGTLENVEALRGLQFDIIFVSHLIEHVLDPVGFVSRLGNRVAERGILVLVTPNIRSPLARVSGRRWVSLKVPEHVASGSSRRAGSKRSAWTLRTSTTVCRSWPARYGSSSSRLTGSSPGSKI